MEGRSRRVAKASGIERRRAFRAARRKDIELRVLAGIIELTTKRGYPPTYRELGLHVGLAHSAVHGHIERLREAGLVIDQLESHARTLVVSPAGLAGRDAA